MRTVNYHGYSAAPTVAAGNYSIRVIRDGRLKGVHFGVTGSGGPGNGSIAGTFCINQGSTSNANVNDPQREETLASCRWITPTGTLYSFDSGFMPCDVPVKAGDILTGNFTFLGTSPQTSYHSADFLVVEAS